LHNQSKPVIKSICQMNCVQIFKFTITIFFKNLITRFQLQDASGDDLANDKPTCELYILLFLKNFIKNLVITFRLPDASRSDLIYYKPSCELPVMAFF